MDKISNDVIIYQNGLNEIRTCDDYLYGYCHLFALCLVEVFEERAELKVLWQHLDTEEYDFGYLSHAYVIIDGKHFIDCRGKIDKSIIKEEYSIYEDGLVYIDDAENEIAFLMREDALYPFLPDEKEQIIEFIESHIGFYEND